MKKLFIGLLIIAAGAGTYYFLQKKKSNIAQHLDKELLVGQWKVNAVHVSPGDSANLAAILLLNDSTLKNTQYDFRKDGHFAQTPHDAAKKDSSYYEWNNKNELLIKESPGDSLSEIYTVNKLDKDSLVLQSKDSAVFVFTRIK
ncbi:MAG TPA: hypothetical protein VE933_06610 [Chitinophagaceae bacterium]|nr:hypothetical protein [Chitinophagaceae bacterium]